MALPRQNQTTTAERPPRSGESEPLGIEPLDERLAGVRTGGSYLLAGVPGSGRSALLLQFLAAGLERGRVGLVTAASAERVLQEARHWGVELEDAWRAGRFRLLSYKHDFQRRLLSAAEPQEVLEEVGELLGDGLGRLGIYPATPLWETRAGTSLAANYVRWVESLGATTLATVGGDLAGALSPATEWVAEAVDGVFLLEKRPNGLHQLGVKRMIPPRPDLGPITMALTPGKGFTAPTGSPGRRATDVAEGAQRRVLLVRFAEEVPAELGSWLDRWYRTETVESPMAAVDRVQEEDFGLVLVYLAQKRVTEAIEALNVLRRLTSAPIILATDDPVRASDRTLALEGGASDFLSGPLSVAELASRAEKAMIARSTFQPRGRKEERAGERSQASGERDDRPFPVVVQERLRSPRGSLFAFVRVPAPSAPAERLHLGEILTQEIRRDAGDLVGEVPGGLGVVLAGTGTSQAEAFLRRVRGRLGESGGALSVEVLSGTADADRIRELAGVEDR